MSTATWGWEVFEQDEAMTGHGRLTVGKTRNGPDGKITLTLPTRRVFQLQKFLEAVVEREGNFAEKRALVLILEDVRLAIAEERERQARTDLLKRHGIKPTPALVAD